MNTPTPETDAEEWPSLQMGRGPNRIEEQMVASSFARKLERERDEAKEDAKQGWEEFERMRLLVPTTAQVMVYQSLLMKFQAAESERDQLRKVCDELANALVNHEGNYKLEKQGCERQRSALINYSQLPHVKAKENK